MDDEKIELSNPTLLPNSSLSNNINIHSKTCTHTHTCSGNREAVKKYREKKKAHTAFLEEEVKKLRFLNRQLVRKLEEQMALEYEISKLRALLVDLKGKVDDELGSFAFQKHCIGDTSLRFDEGSQGIGLQQCLVEKPVFSWQENCQSAIVGSYAIGAVESLGSTKNQDQQ
ncbi:basic leucine zipper 24-like [Silene latifolia]|uniref:basic leucine zipper 24-like n=1 Tax=Silene latifolia TaxID=37657 RepID=UPI003D774BAD